ncbi:MAG: peptidoglycan bridge formation glycyltransferase FemA/FemB family protein [Candidatus Shapirobacteria bacterium]|jgi:lipid II:glycine glycyltransferase (peptidoglycan interpeptide bridge formation enzyme)
MEIKEVSDKQVWDGFVTSCSDYTFVAGWSWGEINKKDGEKVFRLGLYQEEEILGVAQAITISARRGKILFVPHGPLIKDDFEKKFVEFKNYLFGLAKREKCVCLRISPWLIDSESNRRMFKTNGFIDSPSIMHAEDTWLVDVTGTEEEVMSRMRKTTRNLVRRGEREGIKISQSQELEEVEHLYELQMEVVKRNNFVPFSKRYLKLEMEEFFKNDEAVLFLGGVGNDISGVALIVFLGKRAFYYQSGSKETKEPVNYLLQWRVIQEARKRGCTIYNMWGIAPENVPNHPWRGLTIFKTGFGGEAKKYMHAQDLPISWQYHPLRLIEKIPKKWRQKVKI